MLRKDKEEEHSLPFRSLKPNQRKCKQAEGKKEVTS